MASQDPVLDVLIVGAGPAGIGIATVLQDLGVRRMLLLDRARIGESFDRWPREMRFITPSFPSNAFGSLDLNAVALATSPAYTLETEHPTGREYASYLRACARHFDLPVREFVEVRSIQRASRGLFSVKTSQGELTARFVIWAVGEFQYPRIRPFPGSQWGQHVAEISSYRELPQEEFLVIGGYESGIDAAIHLSRLGKRVTVLDRGMPWESGEEVDPSITLSPFTSDRLRAEKRRDRIRLVGHMEVGEIEKCGDQFRVRCLTGETFVSASPPILATGFIGGARQLGPLIETRQDGFPLLTEEDESTISPGLFLSGPYVRHENVIFCFIYKFRQRFAVIAQAIGRRLALDLSRLDAYRQKGMFLDDLRCCGETCAC